MKVYSCFNNRDKCMKVFIISVLIILLDQITKIWVRFTFEYGESVKIFGNYIKLTYVENPGMAFGIDVNNYAKFFLSLFTIIAGIGLIIYLYKIRNKSIYESLPFAFILGGAIGNLIDRVFYGVIFNYAPLMYGKVVDFMDVEFFDFSILGKSFSRWPIFNIADSAVTIGVALIIIFYNKVQTEENKAKTPKLEILAEVPSLNNEKPNE